MIRPVPKKKSASVMVWGGFSAMSRSDLSIMVRDDTSKKHGYTAASYIATLEEEMPKLWDPSLVFMQDNARIHTAKKVKGWLKEHAITLADWPPYSPDLNPIEHIWWELKKMVHRLAPHLDDFQGGNEALIMELGRVLPYAWNEISDDKFMVLIESMPRRVRAVIAAEGWQTKY